MNRDTSVFLDTNIIQTFWDSKNGSNVFLSELGIRSEYYELISFIENNRLNDIIEICIPEIVVMEMKHHMRTGFSKQFQKLEDQIKEHKKAFGILADFSTLEIKHNEEDYAAYVNSLFEDFFNTPKNYARQIPFPRQESIIDTLVNKAIAGIRPFFAGRIGSKNHSDAGFKDSVIAETIYEYSKANNRLCIYVTQDHDFSIEFERKIQKDSQLVLFSSIGEVIEALTEYYETDSQTRLVREFTENTYWHEYLLNEIGIKLDASVIERKVEKVYIDEGDIFFIEMCFVVNEVKYLFSIKFDSIAHDIVEFSYQIEND